MENKNGRRLEREGGNPFRGCPPTEENSSPPKPKKQCNFQWVNCLTLSSSAHHFGAQLRHPRNRAKLTENPAGSKFDLMRNTLLLATLGAICILAAGCSAE